MRRQDLAEGRRGRVGVDLEQRVGPRMLLLAGRVAGAGEDQLALEVDRRRVDDRAAAEARLEVLRGDRVRLGEDLPAALARAVEDHEAGVGVVARLVALERLEDHAVERARGSSRGRRPRPSSTTRCQTTLPVAWSSADSTEAFGVVARDVDEPVDDRGRADDAGALERAAALGAAAERLLPHHLAGVGVQREDVAEVGAEVDAAVGHDRRRVDDAAVRRRRLPGDAEVGDVAGVDRRSARCSRLPSSTPL